MRIAIISDTHMPRGNRRLPAACLAQLAAADLIVHAGDLCSLEVLRTLEQINPVVAVAGNVDDAQLRTLLPETRLVVLGDGLKLGVIHDAGPARGRLERMRRRFPEAAAVIFGHSHLPLRERAPDGFQIFNPGSPTERRRAPNRTMGMARKINGQVEFELVDLGLER
ncbi:MAG TPA: metallophosphoesterase family protein [Solirubrobacteraceae bacterium]|nr:metallophosphoesterase family protein [Solirubrobacteraceae bacterium]